jgi:hypothetical protein
MIKKALESDGLVAARLKLNAEAKVGFLLTVHDQFFGSRSWKAKNDSLKEGKN